MRNVKLSLTRLLEAGLRINREKSCQKFKNLVHLFDSEAKRPSGVKEVHRINAINELKDKMTSALILVQVLRHRLYSKPMPAIVE